MRTDAGIDRNQRNRRRNSILLLVLVVSVVTLAWPAPASAITEQSVPANASSLGQIPPGGTCSNPRDVTFNVTGAESRITGIAVTFEMSPGHTWVSDLSVGLIAPDGATSHTVFSGTGGSNENSDVSGAYGFGDAFAESPTWWEAAASAGPGEAIPPEGYRTSDATGANTLMTPAFQGVGMGNPNGTWTLRFCDSVQQDTGSVSGASLHLATTTPVPPPHCEIGAPCARESDTASQDTLVDVTAAPTEGVLNIEVSQEVVDFGSVQEGTSSSATSVGTLTYTNTLGASRSWDVTVAATDLVKGSDRIDFENLSFDAGNTITPAGATVPITGSTAFSGGDPDGFSAPHPLASAPSTAQGTFTHAGSTAALSVPFGTPAGNDYTGMLQYTITG